MRVTVGDAFRVGKQGMNPDAAAIDSPYGEAGVGLTVRRQNYPEQMRNARRKSLCDFGQSLADRVARMKVGDERAERPPAFTYFKAARQSEHTEFRLQAVSNWSGPHEPERLRAEKESVVRASTLEQPSRLQNR